jgi:hypothetical protein
MTAPRFVAPETYRRRRLVDAARILPFAALLMMLLPMAWEPAAGAPRDAAGDTVYFFLLWAALIAAAAALAPALGRLPPEAADD